MNGNHFIAFDMPESGEKIFAENYTQLVFELYMPNCGIWVQQLFEIKYPSCRYNEITNGSRYNNEQTKRRQNGKKYVLHYI